MYNSSHILCRVLITADEACGERIKDNNARIDRTILELREPVFDFLVVHQLHGRHHEEHVAGHRHPVMLLPRSHTFLDARCPFSDDVYDLTVLYRSAMPQLSSRDMQCHVQDSECLS